MILLITYIATVIILACLLYKFHFNVHFANAKWWEPALISIFWPLIALLIGCLVLFGIVRGFICKNDEDFPKRLKFYE